MPQLFRAKIRRVGTSLGVLIPKDLAERQKIKEGEIVEVGLLKENRLKLIEKTFGMAKGAEPFAREHKDRF